MGVNTASTILLCPKGYSRSIRRVFVEYSRGIHMYRVCVGYVSVMYRLYVEANEAQMVAKIRSEK